MRYEIVVCNDDSSRCQRATHLSRGKRDSRASRMMWHDLLEAGSVVLGMALILGLCFYVLTRLTDASTPCREVCAVHACVGWGSRHEHIACRADLADGTRATIDTLVALGDIVRTDNWGRWKFCQWTRRTRYHPRVCGGGWIKTFWTETKTW